VPLLKVKRKIGATIALGVTLYPNPANTTVNILTTGLQPGKPSSISVISSLGGVVKTMQLNTSKQVIQLDVSSLLSGVYTVKIISGEKVMYKQFIKL
jgi:hypothetical protein